MITLQNVSKKFKNNYVLKNINFKFEKGKIYGITGKNGTGKTVLLKCICGLTKVSDGKIIYKDKVLNKDISILPSIGVIIETPLFWKDKTGLETLEFLASIQKKINQEQILQYLNKVGLKNVKDKKVKSYSLGMRQRLAIAQALMENPEIILFDEPTNSLDSEGVEIFKNLMIEEKAKNKTILIVSHAIDEISEICDEHLNLVDGTLKK
jgi:ABC-2 type transport system ATP-binding protein